QVADLLLGALETRRRDVGRVHGRRQLDGDDERRLVLSEGRRLLPPRRPRDRDARERERRGHEMHRPQPKIVVRTDEERIEQMRRDRLGPPCAWVGVPSPPPDEPQRGRNEEQPPRPEEVERHTGLIAASRTTAATW